MYAHYLIMNERQKKKSLNKKKPITSVSQPYIDNTNIDLLQSQLLTIHNEIKNSRNELTHIVSLSQKSAKTQFDYLKPIITENRQLADALEEFKTYKLAFDAIREQVYTLEKKNHEIQFELEKEKERTFKAKNSLSFMLGNALITYRKNDGSIFSLIKKLVNIRKIAKERRVSPLAPIGQLQLPFLSNNLIHNDDTPPITKIIPTLSGDEYIQLNKKPYWFSYTPFNQDEINIYLTLLPSEKILYKDILARVKFLSIEGEEIEGNVPGTFISSTVGRYIYLDVDEESSNIQLRMTPPKSTGTILIGIQTWQTQKEIKIFNGFKLSKDKSDLNIKNIDDEELNSLKEGVSIIVPSYKGQSTILDMLHSIIRQKFPQELMQIIIVVNGDDTNSIPLYEKFKSENNNLDLIIHYDATPSASNARNVGLKFANRQYSIFLDNDDSLSETYIQALYEKRSKDAIVIAGIHDINENEDIIKNNAANNQYVTASTKTNISYNDISAITTMIACKLLPTHKLKKLEFHTHLRSGEDVVFFCDYLSRFKPIIKAVPTEENAYYIRRITSNSVSRQKPTFDFCIKQRLQVIKELKCLQESTKDKSLNNFIGSKINAQCNFIKNYLADFPEEKKNMLLELKQLSLEDFSYDVINKGKAKTLIISYCFPPFVDTSACVMAKRIRTKGEIVDVIHNNMSKVRSVSNDLNLLVNDLIEERKVVNTPSTFSNWPAIYSFAAEVLKWGTRKQAKYTSVYSRSMWPASHFAAFLVKLSQPSIKWTAEFSDPILWDIKSQKRYEKLDSSFINEYVFGKSPEIDKILSTYKDNDNLYFWCEILPFIFCDEIIFTCTNQRDYMLSKLNDKTIRKIAYNKSTISQHPTLESFYYNLGNASYTIDHSVKNIGYFGAFYSKRNLDDIVQAFKLYKMNGSKDIVLHVFTEQVNDAISFVRDNGLESYIKINSYLAYLDFLKVIKIFDCLIVNDSIVSNEKGMNPYLPSKVSDYMGVDSSIWAIVEEGSALSRMKNIRYMSQAGDITAAKCILDKISKEKVL